MSILPTWLKNGTKIVSHKYKGVYKIIDSSSGNSVYYADGSWDTVSTLIKAYYPENLKTPPFNWVVVGGKVRNIATGSLITVSSWDEYHIFFIDGSSENWKSFPNSFQGENLPWPRNKKRCSLCHHRTVKR